MKILRKVVYVDTSRTATNGKWKRKSHTAYDGEKIFKIDRLTKLDADEVFIDTLFPEIYEEILELLKRGVKIYLLKDIRVLKKLRMENNMEKSDEVDAVMLSMITKDYFRLLTCEELERKIKISLLVTEYEKLTNRIKTLKQWIKNDDFDFDDFGLKTAVKLMEKKKQKIADKLIEIFSNDPIYRESCRMLGVKDSINLVILLNNNLRLDLPLHCIKAFLGLTNNSSRYNRRARKHISTLANMIYLNVKRNVLKSSHERITNIVTTVKLKKKALYKLQVEIVKTLKNIWRIVNEAPAGR